MSKTAVTHSLALVPATILSVAAGTKLGNESFLSQVAAQASPAMTQDIFMCGKCDEIDEKIAHHSRLLSLITDKIARDGIAGLIEEMKTEKAALHPEPEEK